MTQGFYEQLGVDPSAPVAEIRTAYARLVAHLGKRRKAAVEQGGDPSPLDLARAQADEAWRVLADPARRRRYDAMRALQADGIPAESAELWRRVSGALVHPAAGAAAELLRVVTTLKVGALPPAPRPSARQAPADAEVTSPTERGTSPTMVPAAKAAKPSRPPRPAPAPVEADVDDAGEPIETSDIGVVRSAQVVPLREPARTPPARPAASAAPPLKVVDGAASAVVVLPTQPARRKPLSAEDVARLVDQHGYSGALLRTVREARTMTLQEMADTTRISVKYLEAIEADRQDNLPSSTFVRGYVREMARLLSLDEEATVAGYMKRIR